MGRTPDFDDELTRLQDRVPDWAKKLIKNARRPRPGWLRIPLALALILGGILGFLPILGFWMLPLGLAILALDLPFLRGPLARLLAYINRKTADN